MSIDQIRGPSRPANGTRPVPGAPGYRPIERRRPQSHRDRRTLALRDNRAAWERFVTEMWKCGLLYPPLVVGVASLFLLFEAISSGVPQSLAELVVGLVLLFVGALVASGFAIALVFVASLASVIVFLGVDRLVGLRGPWSRQLSMAGSLTAACLLLPMTHDFAEELLRRLADPRLGRLWSLTDIVPMATVLGLGPGLACLIGQVGGARIGLVADVMQRFNARGELSGTDTQPARPQVSIRQMLGGMVVVSVLLAGLRLAGLMTPAVLLAGAFWLVTAAALHPLSMPVARWSLRRHRCKRWRSVWKFSSTPSTVPGRPALPKRDRPSGADLESELVDYWRRHDDHHQLLTASRRRDPPDRFT